MPIYRKFLAFVLLLALPYGLVAYRFATCGQGCEISGDGMLVILALVLFLPFVLAGIVVAAILFGGLGLRRDLRSRSPIGAAIGVVLLG